MYFIDFQYDINSVFLCDRGKQNHRSFFKCSEPICLWALTSLEYALTGRFSRLYFMTDIPDKQWFAAKTAPRGELRVKRRLDALGVENYLPMETRWSETAAGRRKRTVPVIPGLVFLHTVTEMCYRLKNEYSLNVYFIRDKESRLPVAIPDKQMEDFIRLLDFPDGGITVLTSELKRGQRVRIIHGPFKGIEGELMRIGGDRRVVVRLEGVVSIATAFINPAFLEKIE